MGHRMPRLHWVCVCVCVRVSPAYAQQHIPDLMLAIPAAVNTVFNNASALNFAAHAHACCKCSLNRVASTDW